MGSAGGGRDRQAGEGRLRRIRVRYTGGGAENRGKAGGWDGKTQTHLLGLEFLKLQHFRASRCHLQRRGWRFVQRA